MMEISSLICCSTNVHGMCVCVLLPILKKMLAFWMWFLVSITEAGTSILHDQLVIWYELRTTRAGVYILHGLLVIKSS